MTGRGLWGGREGGCMGMKKRKQETLESGRHKASEVGNPPTIVLTSSH